MPLKHLLHLLLLIGLMLGHVPLAAAREIEPGPAASADDFTMRIDLLITAQGQGTGKFGTTTWTTSRYVKIEGSAEVHVTGGHARTEPFAIRVVDDLVRIENTWCGQRTTHRNITDPTRYLGGPDPLWTIGSDFVPNHGLDNTWYLGDLFLDHFYGNGEIDRPFNYRTETQDGCNNTSSVSNGDQVLYDYPIFDVQHQAPLEGDAVGKFFERHDTWTQTVQTGYGAIPMSVDFHATAEIVGGCQSQPAPIDAANPLVRSLKVTVQGDDTILPDETTVLTATVTCEGVPVQNADLQLSVKAKAGSGGHLHNNNRPRGWLNGVKMDNEPFIVRKSKADGTVTIVFEPGQDKLNDDIGIAGEYEITVRPLTKPGNTAKVDVLARVPNLNPLIGNDLIAVVGEVANNHMDTHYGTNGTLVNISLLAMDFRDAVNQIPGLVVCEPWPPKLRVNDISLEGGGLFDVRGWDIQLGQMWSAEWEPPHWTHRDGTVVDISANYPCARNLLRAMLIRLGRQYGTWIGGPVLTLKMAAGLNHRSAISTPMANPDLGVVAFRSDRDVPTVAAGQFITYTVGVGNASSTAPAHDVTLTATLPNNLDFITADPGPTRFSPANQPIWDLGTLSLTNTHIMTVVAQVPPTLTVGTLLTVTADASTSDVEPNLSDNHDAAFGVLVQPAAADLVVESDLGEVALTVDRRVTTTIEVSNFGTVVAPNTQLTVTLPPSVTLMSASPLTSTQSNGVYKWNLGMLGVDESRRVTMTLALSPSLALTQPLTFQLNATSAAPDLHPINNTDVITDYATFAGHDAEVWLNVDGNVAAGQDITYTLGYANYGNQLAPTSTVTLTLDHALTLVSAVPSVTRIVSGTTLAWDLGALPVGAHGAIEIHAHANSLPSSGGVTFAQLSSAGFDIETANNVAYVVRDGYGAAPANHHLYLPLILR